MFYPCQLKINIRPIYHFVVTQAYACLKLKLFYFNKIEHLLYSNNQNTSRPQRLPDPVHVPGDPGVHARPLLRAPPRPEGHHADLHPVPRPRRRDEERATGVAEAGAPAVPPRADLQLRVVGYPPQSPAFWRGYDGVADELEAAGWGAVLHSLILKVEMGVLVKFIVGTLSGLP